MYIYEKENKLNIVFNSNVPVENPDVVISKEGETVTVDVAGVSSALPAVADPTKTYTLKAVDGVWTAVEDA
jgi:hypothetical protein